MAAWTYSDWITLTTAAAQLTRINLHIQEVSDKIQADVAAHGYSRQSHPLNDYLKGLMAERKSLLKASAIGGGRSLVTFPKR